MIILVSGDSLIRYDLIYRQKVSANDLYLGISGATPSIASCDQIAIKIFMPNTMYPNDQNRPSNGATSFIAFVKEKLAYLLKLCRRYA